MLLYRSIGEKELFSLLRGEVIQGRYNCNTEVQTTSKEKNVCCFYVDLFRWKDSQHKFLIVVDIPEKYLSFGIGEYWASNETRKTKTWTGRNGSELYKIREAYVYSYSIKDVKELYLFNHFATWVVDEKISPICDKYKIKLYNVDCYNTLEKYDNIFYKKSYCYQSAEDIDDWLKSKVVDKNAFIEEVKQKVVNSKLSYEKANQIQQILRN